MAREEGIRHFNENDLLNPDTNIRLGTRYLRQTLDKFSGQPAMPLLPTMRAIAG